MIKYVLMNKTTKKFLDNAYKYTANPDRAMVMTRREAQQMKLSNNEQVMRVSLTVDAVQGI